MKHAKTVEESIPRQSVAHVQMQHIRATPDHLVQVLSLSSLLCK